MIGLIWAQAADGVIGAGGALPWHLPEDLAHFKATTDGATVVMGRRTWESLPERFRPLPGRRNVVLTRSLQWSPPGAQVAHTPAQALATAGDGEDVWVIGGEQVYRATLDLADVVVRTEVDLHVPGDARAPDLDARWRLDRTDPPAGWHTSRAGLRYRVAIFRWVGVAPPVASVVTITDEPRIEGASLIDNHVS